MGRRRRSCQNPPELSVGSAAAPSQTIVSAPWSGLRSSGRVARWKRGSEDSSPAVSAQPGCIACTVTNVDDPGRGAALEQSDQQLCEQERPDHVCGQRELDPVGGQLSPLGEDAGVVDQDVEPLRLAGKALREASHRLRAAEVAQLDVDVCFALVFEDPRPGGLAAFAVADGQPDRCAKSGEAARRREPEARSRAGDQHHLALHPRQRHPATAANPVSDVGVTADHREVERGIEQRAGHPVSAG